MPPPIATMRSKLVPLALAYAAERGVDVTALAAALAIPDALRDPAAWSMDRPALPIDRVVTLMERLAEALEDPRFGERLAASLPRGVYGVVELAARAAPSLGAAAERLVRYQRLINDAVVYGIERRGDTIELVHHVPGRPDAVGRHANLFTVSLLARLFRELGGDAMRPAAIELAHREPAPLSALAERLDVPRVRHGAGRNALVYPAAAMERPVQAADPALLAVLDDYATLLLPEEAPAPGWSGRARAWLRGALAGGAPSLADTARQLGTTARNLQRQLASEGTSHSELLEGLREAEARRLLADTELSLGEVTFLLGYSHPRALVRAFGRWTGESPQRWRSALRV